MARPIEPTPPLEGEDAERRLSSLKVTASPEAIARRRKMGEKFLADVARPKGGDAPSEGDPGARIKELEADAQKMRKALAWCLITIENAAEMIAGEGLDDDEETPGILRRVAKYREKLLGVQESAPSGDEQPAKGA